MKNFGKTVARDVDLKRVTTLDGNKGAVSARGIQKAQDDLLADTGEPSIPGLPIPKSIAPGVQVLIPFTMGGTAPSKGFINYLIGRIDYIDSFGVPHWLKFCYFIASAKGDIGICEAGNDEDRNPEGPSEGKR